MPKGMIENRLLTWDFIRLTIYTYVWARRTFFADSGICAQVQELISEAACGVRLFLKQIKDLNVTLMWDYESWQTVHGIFFQQTSTFNTVEKEHGNLTFYNDRMVSLHHFQFKSINISTILTSELELFSNAQSWQC